MQITALQIASLKRVGKGSKIVLMDRNGSCSQLAKVLASKAGASSEALRIERRSTSSPVSTTACLPALV